MNSPSGYRLALIGYMVAAIAFCVTDRVTLGAFCLALGAALMAMAHHQVGPSEDTDAL